MNPTIALLLGVVIGAGLFALGIRYFPQLAREKQNYPFEAQIDVPWIDCSPMPPWCKG